MKSYTSLRNLFGTITNDSSTANLTLGDELMNDSYRRICAMHDWPFLQTSSTLSTVAGQQFYQLPNNCDQIIDVTVTIGTTQYVPRECPTRTFWDLLNQQTTWQSDFPQYFFIYEGQLAFYPMPSSTTANAITFNYRQKVINLNAADYTTGTASIAAGGTTVTGVGTTFTAAMVGRWIQFTSGDQQWYQIASFASTTSITITAPYQGSAVSGSAFIIGDMSLLPDAYQDLQLWDAVSLFYTSINPDMNRAAMFKAKFDEMRNNLEYDFGTKTTDVSLHDNIPRKILNPNLFIVQP
jgi:hypothetical protein